MMLSCCENEKEFVKGLNFWRGLFACIIVIGHCSMNFEKEFILLALVHRCNIIGVWYFLFVSGFSMAYNNKIRSTYMDHFLRNKVFLLMVFALISQIVEKILAFALCGSEPKVIELLSGWNWYVYEIIVFYFAFAGVNRFISNKGARLTVLFLVAILISVATLLGWKYGSWTGWTRSFYVSTFLFPFGVFCEYYYDEIIAFARKKLMLLGLLCAVMLVCMGFIVLFPKNVLSEVLMKNIAGMAGISFVAFVTYFYGAKLSCKLEEFFTGISTEIYLYQFGVLRIVKQIFDHYDRKISFDYVIIVFFTTVVLALLMNMVNKKITALVKK